jgi:hypothetical protein
MALALLGRYGAAVEAVAGGAAAVPVASIGNPVASGRIVLVRRVLATMNAIAVAAATTRLELGRTTALASDGTLQTAQRHRSSFVAPVAEVRSAPTATMAAGLLAALEGHALITAVGASVPAIAELLDAREPGDLFSFGRSYSTSLDPGESLLVRLTAGDTDMRVTVLFDWYEGTDV